LYVRGRSEPFLWAYDAFVPFLVISTARLESTDRSGRRDDALLWSRLGKVLTRKLGNLYFRLPPSPDPTSLMRRTVPSLEVLDGLPDGLRPADVVESP
jgi:hypothetical protein